MQPLLSLCFAVVVCCFFFFQFAFGCAKERLPLNMIVCYLEEFLFVKCFCDLFNKRLLKICVCLQARHISFSPRFNQSETLQSSRTYAVCTHTAIDNGNAFFFVCCRYGCSSFYLTKSLSSLK